MSNNQIIATVLVHLFTALIQLFIPKRIVWQMILSVAGALTAFLFALKLFMEVLNGDTLTMNAANWDAPFGIVFVADMFSVTMVLLTSVAALAVAIFSAVGVGRSRLLYGYFPIFHFLIMGLNGAFLTGDVFNLYVWFEVVIISSFVLLTLGGRKAQLEGAVKYMAMNILASMFFLTGIGILYGITGTLNMADLSLKIPLIADQTIVNLTSIFFLIGFGVKSAAFPLYFWLPSSYHTPPSAVAAVFGGLLTKLGLYALFRFFTLLFIPGDFLKEVFLAMAVATVLTGCFGALVKMNIRRMLSYLIVCHIGFVIGGLGLYTKVALLGAVFYMIHDIIIKTNLFLIAGLIRQMRGTMDMGKLGGIYGEYPKISFLLALAFFSLVGIPPLSGFWPKIYLFAAGLESRSYFFIASIIFGSFCTLFVIAKLWSEVFWKDAVEDVSVRDNFKLLSKRQTTLMVLPIFILTGTSLFIGLNAEFIIRVADRIAVEMIDTTPYARAVLGH